MAVHCPECGFVVGEAANFCPKCGAYLADMTAPVEATTATYHLQDSGEIAAIDVGALQEAGGAALVVRAGGGREGESVPLAGERVTIGRRPSSDLFLDDVTVSRDHALVVSRADGWHLDDLGSLNGTYVNRRRIESALLRDGDEVQVGKFKLTFLGH
ncbi:FHA domain-containing protein [Patulibacter sp. S7RM1-6]